MPENRTEALNFRVRPTLKESVIRAALKQRRSVANLLETILEDWLAKNKGRK